MTTGKEQLKELVAQTRQHLCEQYDQDEWLTTDRDSYHFFRGIATTDIKPEKKSPPQKITSLTIKKPGPLPKLVNEPKKDTPPPPPAKIDTKIQLEQPKSNESVDLNAQTALIRKVCPNIQIIEEIPKPKGGSVNLFSINPDAKEKAFWEKVLQALKERGVKGELIVCETLDHLLKLLEDVSSTRLLLIPRKLLSKLPGIDNQHTFKNIPLIPLEEAALYEKDLYLKRMLWQNLRSKLKI